jgi:hypothetical protein
MGNSSTSQSQSQLDIATVCDEVKELLLEKNFKYGDAVLYPARIFSRANTDEQINVRIDDKLNRIANRKDNEDEDPEWDLLGYLILKRVEKKQRERRQGLTLGLAPVSGMCIAAERLPGDASNSL